MQISDQLYAKLKKSENITRWTHSKLRFDDPAHTDKIKTAPMRWNVFYVILEKWAPSFWTLHT